MNVALRAKLTEEIKENTDKVKVFIVDVSEQSSLVFNNIFHPFRHNFDMFIDQTICAECIEVLAAVCEMTSLATLSLYFPPQKIWQFEMLNVSRKAFLKRAFKTKAYFSQIHLKSSS